MKRIIILATILAWTVWASPAPARDLIDVNEIVKRANHVALYQGTAMKGRVHLKITDRQNRVRERTLNILRLDREGKGGQDPDQDQFYFTYFKAPADVRKMVFMVHKHADPAKDDDRWLYMPAMDLVKRIAAGDKRTSFVGSDFLYEDISGRAVTEDTHVLVRTTADHYVVENVPKQPKTVEFSDYLAHVRKDNFITEKLEFRKKGGRVFREMTVLEVLDIPSGKKGETYPTVVKSRVRNLDSGSATEMTFSHITYTPKIKESLFSERYLRRPPRDITR